MIHYRCMKRPWFRYHLSTLVLFVLIYGAFLGLNSRRWFTELRLNQSGPPAVVAHYGWPLETYSVQPPPVAGFEFWDVIPNSPAGWRNFWLNFLLFAGTLGAVVFGNEWRIRREDKQAQLAVRTLGTGRN